MECFQYSLQIFSEKQNLSKSHLLVLSRFRGLFCMLMSRSLTRDPFNIFRPRFFVLFCGHLRYYSLTRWWSQKPSSRAWEVQNVYFFRKKPNDATISSYLSTKFQVEKLIRIFVSVGSSKWRLSHTQIIRKVFSLKSILFQKVNLCLQLIAFEILRWISWLCKEFIEGKIKDNLLC